MPRQLGDLDVFITISPDTRLFRSQADAAIKRELAGVNPNVRIGADTKSAQAAIAAFQGRVAALNKALTGMRADIKDDKGAESKIAGIQGRVLALATQMKNLTMSADAKKLDAQIAGEIAKLRGLQQQMDHLQADADTKKAALKIADLNKQVFLLRSNMGNLKSDVEVKAARAKIASLLADLKVLNSNARAVKLAADSTSIQKQIDLVQARLAGLRAEAKDIQLGTNIDPAKLVATESALLAIEHTVGELGKKDAPVANTAMNAFIKSTQKSSTFAAAGWKLLTGHITLFGGVLNRVLPKMFTSVAVWHLLADAIIETVAVWAPAIVAATAFGVAGYQAAEDVYKRMKDVHTVMNATGQAVPPLTSQFKNLQAAVRPEVYQLFGDALLVMNKRGGVFNQVATQTGQVIDRLAARFVYAVTTGGGVNKFMEHAVSDFAKLGDSIANFGGIFGAVFRAVPGYAEILLSVGDAITKVLEGFTQFAEPVIAAGLALHGFFIYGGTAITVALAMVAGIVKLGSAFTKFNEAVTLVGYGALRKFGTALLSGIRDAAGYSVALLGLARSEGVAGAASIALADAQNLLGKIPTQVWFLAAAAAAVTFIHWIATAKDAAQQFNSTIQDTVRNAPLANVLTVIQQSQAATSARLAQSARQVNAALREQQPAIQGVAGHFEQSYNPALDRAATLNAHYRQGLTELDQEHQRVAGRVAALSKIYGGNTQALGALTAAGITSDQITSKSTDTWAQALIQVEATTAAYKAMGTQAGTLGNDLDVLGRTETDQYTATQKLNQAWSSFITDVTSTQGSFDTVAQGFETLAGHSGGLSLSLGKLKARFTDTAGAAKNQAALSSATAAVASAQAALNKLQGSGKATAAQLTAAHARLAAAQDRVTAAQLSLAAAQNQGKAAIDALTPAGIALNQAFTDQVQNIDKLFASWRTAGLASNLFTEGVKSAIAPLVKYAAGSKEATAQLVALAEEAGYQGPNSMSALVKWLGNTHGATQKLKDITDQATQQEALLTGAMQNQGDYIANTLIKDIQGAILAYEGVEPAAKAYGATIAQYGKDSIQAHEAGDKLVAAIVKAGVASGSTTDQMAALIAKILGIPRSEALKDVNAQLGSINKILPISGRAFDDWSKIHLHLSTQQADALWKKLTTQLGPGLENLAGSTLVNNGKAFDNWAKVHLQLGHDRAEALRLKLLQLQAQMASETTSTLPVNGKAFQNWARSALDLGTSQADKLWKKLVQQLGPGLGGLTNLTLPNSKKMFDDWAHNALGLSYNQAEALRRKLIDLQNSGINALHGKTVHVNFVGSGSGSIAFKESIPGVTVGPSSQGLLGFHAAGGRVPGFAPGVDNHPAMLSGGEYIFTPEAASAIGYDNLDLINKAHSRRRTGYAAGGAVGGGSGVSSTFTGLGDSAGVLVAGEPFMAKAEAHFGRAVEAAFAKAVIAKFKKDAAAALSGSGQGVLAYAMQYLHKVPYVWGGSTPSGWDCSGFVSWVYDHLKLYSGRTTAAGFQSWAKPSGPVPGGLAFYGSPAHHVGFVTADGRLLSALGRKWGTTITALGMGDNSGYGIPPQGFGGGPGGGGGASPTGSKLKELAYSMLAARGWAGQWAAFNSLENREAGWCLTLDHMILTKRGWLKHDEVTPGDETIGYNLETGKSEWTRVTAVHHYDDKPVVTYGNKFWQATFTPRHRWLTEARVLQGERPGLAICPICGFTGKNAKLGIRNHMVRSHGWVKVSGRARETWQEPQLTPWDEFTGKERVILSRPADTGPGLPVTDREAALLGWIAGDGCVVQPPTAPEQCPDCGWLPFVASGYSDGRIRHSPKSKSRSVNSHRIKKHGYRGTYAVTRGLSVSVAQAKPENFAAIEDALTDVPGVGRYAQDHRGRPSGGVRFGVATLVSYTWRLPAVYAHDLLRRAGNPKTDTVEQVLRMSPSQRRAWLEAMIAAEGHIHVPVPGKPKDGPRTVIYQNEGVIADAIELAVYLEGYRPGRGIARRAGDRTREVTIGLNVPHVGGPQRNSFSEDAGTADVWCVTTELGSWTTRNESGVFLTGNSLTARNPSSGAYGLAQFINGPSEYAQYGGNSVTAQGQLTGMLNYIAQRYGNPNNAWAHEIAAGWYGKGGPVPLAYGGKVKSFDQGGYLPPRSLTLAYNGTNAMEPVGMASGGVIAAGLRRAQAGERTDYGRLRSAYLYDLAHAKAGSWTAGHRTGIISELGTLARREAAEITAYGTAVRAVTKPNLSKLGTKVREVLTTSRDIDLSHSHPNLTRGLQYWLGRLEKLSGTPITGSGVSGGGGSGGGSGGSTVAPLPHLPPLPRLTAAQFMARLKHAQAAEQHDYAGLRAAYLYDLAHSAKGSWTYGHRTGIQSELGTLMKRQAAEVAAYNTILHGGGSKASLSAFAAKLSSLVTTSADADLVHNHPGRTRAFRYWLAVLEQLAGHAPSGVAGATSIPPASAYHFGNLGTAGAFARELQGLQAREARDYTGLVRSLRGGQSKTIVSELATLAREQAAEILAYHGILGSTKGNLSAATLAKLGSAARAEASTTQDAALVAAHPGGTAGLRYWLGALSALSGKKVPPVDTGGAHLVPSPPAVPLNTIRAHAFSFDSGGSLAPGWNLAWNGTGAREDLVPARGGDVHIHVHNHGVIGSRAEVDNWLNGSIDRLARQGRLSYAFKRSFSAT